MFRSLLGHFWAVMTPGQVTGVNSGHRYEMLQCGRIPHPPPFEVYI